MPLELLPEVPDNFVDSRFCTLGCFVGVEIDAGRDSVADGCPNCGRPAQACLPEDP